MWVGDRKEIESWRHRVLEICVQSIMKVRFPVFFGPFQHLGARVEDGAGVHLLLGLPRHPTWEQEAAGIGDR